MTCKVLSLVNAFNYVRSLFCICQDNSNHCTFHKCTFKRPNPAHSCDSTDKLNKLKISINLYKLSDKFMWQLLKLQIQACKEQEKPYPEIHLLCSASRGGSYDQMLVFFHRGPGPASITGQTTWCKSMGSNSEICFHPISQCAAPALVYCTLLSLTVKMKYSFHLGFSMTLITAVVFAYFTCKPLINLSLWSPVRHTRSIITV